MYDLIYKMLFKLIYKASDEENTSLTVLQF